MANGVRVLVNGAVDDRIAVGDRGFQYGDGIFTTLRVERGVALFLAEHLERLQRDALRLGLPVPDRDLVASEVQRLARNAPQAIIKVILTRGAGGRGYRVPQDVKATRVVGVHPMPEHPSELCAEGVRVRVCRLRLGLQPALAGVKHLNRLEQVLARAEWRDEDVREGLLLDTEDQVVEGVMSNLFLVEGERLRTPLLDRCGVAGVMRGVVMRLASEAGLRVEEARITLADVDQAEELFLTNSVIGLWPVHQLEDRRYGVGRVTRQLIGSLDAAIEQTIARACTA